MNAKPLSSLARLLFILLALLLSGCVWLRLLEIKNQLAEFDDNVRIEVANRHFIVHLLRPVLLSEDFTYLSKLNPSRVEPLPGGAYRWYLDFRIDPARTLEQKARRVSFVMTWTPRNRLASFDFSPLFMEMAPAAFLEASIRSLGVGKVDQDRKQLKVDPEDLPRLTASLPKAGDILSVMGPPLEDHRQDGLRLLVYRFLAESQPVEPEYEARRVAEAKLYFDARKDGLIRLKGQFAGLKLSIDYRKLTGQAP